MKIGQGSNELTPEQEAKLTDLPSVPNCYLEIPKLDTAPGTGVEGEVYYNTTESKFYLYQDTAWVEALFSMKLLA